MKPRTSNFMGMREKAHVNPDGTWLEPESLCYPNGGMTRKALAVCPDGIQRTVRCGIPDTYFSIPARLRIKGTTIVGYVTGKEDANGKPSVEFRVMDSHKAVFEQLTRLQHVTYTGSKSVPCPHCETRTVQTSSDKADQRVCMACGETFTVTT